MDLLIEIPVNIDASSTCINDHLNLFMTGVNQFHPKVFVGVSLNLFINSTLILEPNFFNCLLILQS